MRPAIETTIAAPYAPIFEEGCPVCFQYGSISVMTLQAHKDETAISNFMY